LEAFPGVDELGPVLLLVTVEVFGCCSELLGVESPLPAANIEANWSSTRGEEVSSGLVTTVKASLSSVVVG